MSKYFTAMRDGSDMTIYYDANNDEDAVKLTESWIRTSYAEYEDEDSTTWFDYSIYKVPLKQKLHYDDDDEVWSIDSKKNLVSKGTVSIHPKEPDCVFGSPAGHRWTSDVVTDGGRQDNPGVFIHGLGVLISQHCPLCSMTKIVDTNAQREDTGENGLHAITYRKLDEHDDLWIK